MVKQQSSILQNTNFREKLLYFIILKQLENKKYYLV